MTAPGASLRLLVRDIRISVLFCTRLPLGGALPVARGELARAIWALPIAGALVGGIGAFAYLISLQIGLPPLLAALLALAATLGVTGCLHEDGLADTVDGFGCGADRAHKLAIMRDAALGTYGTCALLLSLALRAAALASIADPAAAASALVAAHAAARATLPALMWLVPPARSDGLSADAGTPLPQRVAVAALIGVAALALGLPATAAVAGVILLALATALMAWLSLRQIGGQTGDVLGALEQINEILVLLIAAALLQAALPS